MHREREFWEQTTQKWKEDNQKEEEKGAVVAKARNNVSFHKKNLLFLYSFSEKTRVPPGPARSDGAERAEVSSAAAGVQGGWGVRGGARGGHKDEQAGEDQGEEAAAA